MTPILGFFLLIGAFLMYIFAWNIAKKHGAGVGKIERALAIITIVMTGIAAIMCAISIPYIVVLPTYASICIVILACASGIKLWIASRASKKNEK